MNNTQIDMKLEAEKLVKQGYKVFPCCWPDGNGNCECGRKDKYGNLAPHTGHDIGKAPLTKHGFLDATATLQGVREFWGKYPKANIGIPADGILYLDFDLDHKGMESKTTLETKEGKLPKTRVVKTGGGGEHWYYKQPTDYFIGNTTSFAGYPGFDTRGDNKGYVIAPPSLHKSGNRYEIKDDSPIADCPKYIIRLAKESQHKNKMVLLSGNIHGGKIPNGNQNLWLYKRACSYRNWGDTDDIIFNKLKMDLQRCDQDATNPFTDQDLITIVKSACRHEPGSSINPPDNFIIVGDRRIPKARGIPCQN